MICLLCGAAGYLSFLLITIPKLLIVSEVGIGIAWASILAMPYAILARACRSESSASIWACSMSSSSCPSCWWRP